jgi:hypothetical protein
VSIENYFIYNLADRRRFEKIIVACLGFFLAGRRPADAGLLGVSGAPMSGPGLHLARELRSVTPGR